MYILYVSNLDGSNSLKFPIPLQELPSISKGATTDSFTAWDGKEYTFITGRKPIEFSLTTWLPKNGTKYKFQVNKNANESTYVNFLNLALEQKKPIKVVISSKKGMAYINGAFVIPEFTESKNQYGDTVINLSCKEWFKYAL